MPNQVEVVARPDTLCGEGPIWDPRANRLLFVDNAQNLVYQLPADRGEPELISRGLMVGGIALMEGDSLLFAGATGVPSGGRRATTKRSPPSTRASRWRSTTSRPTWPDASTPAPCSGPTREWTKHGSST